MHLFIDNHLLELDPLPRFCLGANPSPHSPNRGPTHYHSSWKKRARSVLVHIPDRPSPVDLGLFKASTGAMIILAWNYRGLASRSTVLDLKAIITSFSPDILILSETKISSSSLSPKLQSFHFYNNVHVPPVGLSGGLCLAWKDGVDFEPTFLSKNVISGLVYSDPSNSPWLLSTIYGPPNLSDRATFWDNLSIMTSNFNGPWLLIGDFNGTLSSADKVGGNLLGPSVSLRSNVEELGLIPITQKGIRFTWNNHRKGKANIRAKLDQGIANEDWFSLFPNASLKSLPVCTFDHCPLILNTLEDQGFLKRQFKFEAMWTRDNYSFYVVEHAWKPLPRLASAANVCHKIAQTRIALSNWNKNQLGKLKSNIAALRKAISEIQAQEKSQDDLGREQDLKYSLNEQLLREELHWRQKSRVRWLQEGDNCDIYPILKVAYAVII
ncbi:Endonuclease/exonuclease/phosphatase [Trema orientale]|uniref:Endonuclease/exonuclease/phosphatase n=1 Tax=Trema orientale TaxID=63057 RepID=A0A2P5CGV7_TREOI|nr:Endonuclease/exonuclease/phosphatase [Trema orientale]